MLVAGGSATFVPADPTSVPGDGVLAFWAPDGEAGGAASPLRLVLRRGHQARTTTVSADLVALADAVPALAQLPVDADVTPSVAAWATATKLAVDLVARGRLLPSTTPVGVAAWRVGPLDPADHRRLDELAAAMPPEAHAVPIPGRRPLRIRGAWSLIDAFLDAVADRFVRTAAAAVAGGGPFATTAGRVDDEVQAWIADLGAGIADRAFPGVRLHLPSGPEGQFAAVVQLRSHLDPSLVIDAADLWDAPGPVLARLGEHADTDLLLALRRATRAWEPIGRLLDQARPETLALTDHEVEELLGPAAERLSSAGLEVLWPSELLSDGIELRAVLGTPSPASVAEATFTLDRLLEFRWEAAIGDHVLSAAELEELAEAKRPLVRLRGRWILADPGLAERLRRKPRRLTAVDGLAAALTGTLTINDEVVNVVVDGTLAALADRLRAGEDMLHELGEPHGLDATLRPYQRRGLAWLAEMTSLGLGGCLADDMGLGKTVQLIALHLHRHTDGNEGDGLAGPTLVVCPASVLGNWEREVNRFAPKVRVRRYHGGERHLEAVADDEIVLATYGLVRRDREALAEVEWGLVAADEAQHVKNPLSRTARELRAIPAAARVALTGTPVENRLTDLWSILDWTTPGLLGSLDGFRRRVAVPVERHRDPAATEQFGRLVRPFLLRRRKIDPGIAPDLPPKTESDEVVPLTPEQATLYEAVVRNALAAIAEAEGLARRGLVLKLLTGLKQICNHPAQYLKQPGPLTARSGKLDALDELVDLITEAGESVLVFTQYVAMARLLERHLQTREVPTLFLHGGVAARRRDKLVDRFQAGEVPVFLLSLKAGGTGLNLTRATQVIHYDRWWNPAVEDQASDRAWRIGQDHPVHVHRLVTEGTVEDRVAALLRSKRELADAVVGTGEAWLAELSDAELADLVSLQEAS